MRAEAETARDSRGQWKLCAANLLSKREMGWDLHLLKINMHLVRMRMKHRRMFIRLEINLEKCILPRSDIVTAGIHIQKLDDHYKTAAPVWGVPVGLNSPAVQKR